MRQSGNKSPILSCQRTPGNINTGSKHPGRLEKAVTVDWKRLSINPVCLYKRRPWVSCRPRATNIYSPEAHLGLSETHGRRFGSEEGDKGKMMETEQRSRGRERGKAGTGDVNGENPPTIWTPYCPKQLLSTGSQFFGNNDPFENLLS